MTPRQATATTPSGPEGSGSSDPAPRGPGAEGRASTRLEPAGAGESEGWTRLVLLCALLLGGLRFVRLGHFGLWLDEALTWTDYHYGLDDGLIGNPLGYRMIGGFVEALGGEPTEWSLRLLPALFGLLVIALTYWALHPGVGRRGAAVGALILAVSPWQLYWSQTARFYTMAQATTLLGSGLFLRAVFSGADALSPRTWALGLVGLASVASGMAFHVTSLLVIGGLLAGTVVLACSGDARAAGLRRLLPWLVAFVIALGLLLKDPVQAWLAPYLRHNRAPNPAHFAMTLGYYLTPLLGTAFALAVIAGLRRKQGGALFVASAGAAIFVAGHLASLVGTVSAQYVLVALPFVTAAVGHGVAGLVRREHRLAALALLVLPALTECGLYFTVHGGNRPAWREAYALVAEERRPTDLIYGMAAPVGEFYLRSGSARLRNPVEVLWLTSFTARAGLLDEWTRRPRRIWLVVREEIFREFDPEDRERIQRFLREDCRRVAHFPSLMGSRDLSVVVYLRE